jgi:hypothetical protein
MLVSEILVNDSSGLIDVQATLDAFKPLLVAARAKQEEKNNVIGTAVNAIFDTWKGQRVPMTQLVSYVTASLNVAPGKAYTEVATAVKSFVAANPSIYSSGKGFRGVGRIADLPVKALPAPKGKRGAKKADKASEQTAAPAAS